MNSSGHIFKRYDSEMRHLHGLVLGMGQLAVEQLARAVKTLERQDVEQAQQVIENDRKLNDLDVQADDEIVRIIALRQPMARDLREIIAVGKIIAELERAGDEARKIAGLTLCFHAAGADGAESARDGKSGEPPARILADIYALSEYVGAMLTAVMGAFDDLDLKRAVGVLGQGETLDERLQSSWRGVSDLAHENSDHLEHFVDIVLGIRALERFGGHAKNIAGHIIFIKHGTDVRHQGVADILQQVTQAPD